MSVIRCVRIGDDLELQSCTPEEAVGAIRDPDSRIWIDLCDAGSDEFQTWLDRLEVSGLMRELCLTANGRSGIYPLKQEILLVLPVLTESTGQSNAEFLGLFCRENLLLSWHASNVVDIAPQASLEDSESWLDKQSMAAIVAALIMDLSYRGLQYTTGLRAAVREVEVQMEYAPDTVDSEQILDLRSALLGQETVISDQIPPLRTLSMTDRPYFRLENARDYMTAAVTNLESAERALGRLERRVDALLIAFQMNSQAQTNRRLGMLTILSAIFMPITLMAGIWGMNFERMPELGWTNGYFLGLGAMAFVAISMFLFFRRGGWFG